jgi:hypothetical protein
MKRRWLIAMATMAASAQTAAVLAACANDGETGAAPSEQSKSQVPASDGGDGGDEAGDPDAGRCVGDDCAYYPDECTEDALCSGGLFNPVEPASGLDLRTHVTALTGRSPNDIWLAGTVGGLAHFDGASWKRSALDTQQSFYALWLLGNAEVAFDDPLRLYTRGLDTGTDAGVSPGGWSFFGAATVPSQWGDSAMRVATTYAYPGAPSLWIGVTTQSYNAGGLWRMRRSSEDGTFAVTAMAADGCGGFPCREFYALHGVSADEIWAVGPRGAALRVTNAESDSPTRTGFNTLTVYALNGVWAASSNDVWAVGSTGTVRRYRGDARFWEVYEDLPTTQHLRAIAGSSPSDIWIAGDEGTVFHYDGTSWKRVKVAGLGGRRPSLDRIWVPAPGKVWIAGQGILISPGGKP